MKQGVYVCMRVCEKKVHDGHAYARIRARGVDKTRCVCVYVRMCVCVHVCMYVCMMGVHMRG